MTVDHVWGYDDMPSNAQRFLDGTACGGVIFGSLWADTASMPESHTYSLFMSALAFATLIFRAWQAERDRQRKDSERDQLEDERDRENREKRHALANTVQHNILEVQILKHMIEELEEQSKQEKETIADLRAIRDMDRKTIAKNAEEIATLKEKIAEMDKEA